MALYRGRARVTSKSQVRHPSSGLPGCRSVACRPSWALSCLSVQRDRRIHRRQIAGADLSAATSPPLTRKGGPLITRSPHACESLSPYVYADGRRRSSSRLRGFSRVSSQSQGHRIGFWIGHAHHPAQMKYLFLRLCWSRDVKRPISPPSPTARTSPRKKRGHA